MKLSIKMIITAVAAFVAISSAFAKDGKNGVKMEKLKLDKKWDKTFELSDTVSHKRQLFQYQ